MKIKTRDALRRTVRTLDRTVKATGRGAGEAQRQAGEAALSDSRSENEHAGNQVQNTGRTAARAAVYGADRFGRWGMRQTGKNIRKVRSRRIKVKPARAKQLTAPARKVLQAPRQAMKTSKRTTQMMKAAIRATVNLGRCAIKATIAATKTAVAAIKEITAAIVAGGWIVVVVILLLCAVGMAVGQVAGADFSGGELPQITEDWDTSRTETKHNDVIIYVSDAEKVCSFRNFLKNTLSGDNTKVKQMDITVYCKNMGCMIK